MLLVTIDSLRADHVGYHGYNRDITPNIDKYAEEGSRFMNSFAHAGGTKISFPSILSSVDSLMYGGHQSGVSDDFIQTCTVHLSWFDVFFFTQKKVHP